MPTYVPELTCMKQLMLLFRRPDLCGIRASAAWFTQAFTGPKRVLLQKVADVPGSAKRSRTRGQRSRGTTGLSSREGVIRV